MDPRHHLIHKGRKSFRDFKIRHDIKMRYRKFIWGTFTGDSTRSFWKHRRKAFAYYKKMYHVDYDSDHDDYEFLTHPNNIINAQKRRRALRIVKVKLQKLFYEEEDRYLLQKPPYVDEEFHPNTNSRTMKLNLRKMDILQQHHRINKMLPIFFNEGFITYLQENNKFTKNLFHKLQKVFRHKKLKKYGQRNIFNYLKDGIRYIGRKYQKKDFKYDLMKNENKIGQEDWRQLRLKAHPNLKHYETDQNLKDEQFQILDVNLGEDDYRGKKSSNLNVTETFDKICNKLKQIIKINPKSLFRFSYFIKSYLFLLQTQFKENELSDHLQFHKQLQSKGIFQIKKKAEEWVRSKQMKRSNKKRKENDTEKQYKLLVKKIQSEVQKKEKQRQKQLEMDQETYYERDNKRHFWMNFQQGVKQVSQIMGNEKSFLHQDDIFVDQSRDQDYESVNEDEFKKKKQKTRNLKKNFQQKKSVQKQKKNHNYYGILSCDYDKSIRKQKKLYHSIIQNYHDIRLFQDLLDKEDIGFPQEYLQYIQVDEESKQERQSTRRSKSLPSRGNKERKIKQKRSYSQEKMNELLEQFDQIAEKECQRDLFRIASTMMQQKEVDFRDRYYKRIRTIYFKTLRPRKLEHKLKRIIQKFNQNESYFVPEQWLEQFQNDHEEENNEENARPQLTRYERQQLRRQHLLRKHKKKSIQSEDDYQHRIFLKQLIAQDKNFFSRIFGIDVVDNYLYYYKAFASQLIDNCLVCLESVDKEEDNDQEHYYDLDSDQDQDLEKKLQQYSEQDEFSPEKKVAQKEETLTNEQIMPLYLKLAKKHQKRMKKRQQKTAAEQVLSNDEFAFENDRLDSIKNMNKNNQQTEDLRNFYGMEVEINHDQRNDEDEGNQGHQENDEDNIDYEEVGFGFGSKINKKPIEEKFKVINKFKKIYLGRNKWKCQKENNDQIDLEFPLFQDMYNDELQNDCFSMDGIYFDKTQRGQHHYYQQLLTIQCRPQVSQNLSKKIQDSSKPNLLRVFHKDIYQVQSTQVLKSLNLYNYPFPIDILKEKQDVLIQNEFKERVLCLRFHNLPINPIRQMENEFEAQINYYRQFAQYTGLRHMPKCPDTPYQAYKNKNFKGQQSISQSVKAVKGWMAMSLKDRKDYLRTFYSEVIICFRRLDKWLKAANYNEEDLYFMGVMDLEDFVWHLYHLDICCELLEKQVKLSALSFDDVLIHYIRRNHKKRHPDKMTKQKIQKLLKLRRDPKARAKAKKQQMKKKVKRFRKKKNQERKRLNIATLQARRNKKQEMLYAQYFGKKGPLLSYFENVFVKKIRIDVHGIMKKQIDKYKLKEKIIYVDGKGYQKDKFILHDHQGYERQRAIRISEKYGDGYAQQNMVDLQQIIARRDKTWINKDQKNVPPTITKTSNNIQIDQRNKDYKNEVRVCRKVYLDKIGQKSKELAQQQNIETNTHIFQKQQENLGFTTVQFDDKEWLVSSNDIKPFKQLIDMTKELEQNEQETILKKKINAKNKQRRILLRKYEVRYQRKKNLYIYRDLPDDQAPADPREFILNVDEDGILNRLKLQQDFGKWSQNVAYYKAKGWDLTPLLLKSQKEIQGKEQNKQQIQQKLIKQKLRKELKIAKTKANAENDQFLREIKQTQYIASMLKIDENYGQQFENSDEKLEQENQQEIESDVPDLKLTEREKIRMRKILKKLKISQQDQSETGINQLTEFVKDNKDPISNLYENLVVAEQLEKDIQDARPVPKLVHKLWYKKKHIKQPSPIRPFLDEDGNIVKGIRKSDYLKELYVIKQQEDQRIEAELAELRIKRQGMTQQEILDELLKTPKEEQRPQVRRPQLQDIIAERIAISKKKNITKKKQKKDSDESSSEREQKKGRRVRQVSQRQTKNHQVQQRQTKGKQENNIKPNNQQVKQGESKIKGKQQKLCRNIIDKEEQEEIEQESQIILQNKRRQRKVHKNKVPILFDSSDDQGDEQSEDISFDDSSDEKQKNKKKGGQKQKGKNNRK